MGIRWKPAATVSHAAAQERLQKRGLLVGFSHSRHLFEGAFNYHNKSLSGTATAFVKRHDWPGNVRQLQNVLVQAAVLADGDTIEQRDLKAALGELQNENRGLAALLDRPIGDGFNLEEYLNSIHRTYLRRAMEEAKGVKTKAARLLGMENYQTLDAQLKRLEVTGDWQN